MLRAASISLMLLFGGTRPKLVPPVPGLSNWLFDYGNDPRSGVRAKILNSDERGIHVAPELDCELGSINVIVEDSNDGRQIDARFYPGSQSALLESIARAGRSATLTGLKHWPGANSCVASIAWAIKSKT